MRKYLLHVLIISFVFLIIPCNLFATPATAMRGISVVTEDGTERKLYSDYYALVVGVGEYDYYPDLQGAVKDAKEVAKELEGFGFEVKLVINPTSEKFRIELEHLTMREGREKERAILFYYAGHGETETLATEDKLGYLVPADCPAIEQDEFGFGRKAISMDLLDLYALKIKSKLVLMMFDSCFSGSIFSSLKGLPPKQITEKSSRSHHQITKRHGDFFR